MRRRRWRTVVLWAGCTLCVLIAVAFVRSGWYLIGLQFTAQGPAVGVTEGGCFFTWSTPGGGTPIAVRIPLDFLEIPTSTLPRQRMPNWELWNLWEVYGPLWDVFLGSGEILVPVYALFLAVAVPTLLVWRFLPKFPRGHCRRCGYNLKGLTEARCPECGARFERRAHLQRQGDDR